MKIENAIERFTRIQEEINSLTKEAVNIVIEHLDHKACPKWHTLILTAVETMENELGDLEDEAVEQEEAGVEKEILDFCQKYPKIKLFKKLREEMQTQGFSINITKHLIIIETPYTDYLFDKKCGSQLELTI